jgi:thiol-disulfide isomerase/thioredoxin
MKLKAAFLFLIFTAGLTPVFAGGGQESVEETPAADELQQTEDGDASRPVDTVEDEPSEPQFSPLEQKLGSAGFQLPKESFPAADFTLQTLGGEEVSLFDYEGKLVFLNFWATWCPPCRAEMPSMERVYNKLPSDSFVILAVNVNEPKEDVQSFMDEHGYTFPVLLDSDGRVSSIYQVEGIPTTWLIGPDTTVVGRLVGTTEWDTPEMLEIFNELLENTAD